MHIFTYKSWWGFPCVETSWIKLVSPSISLFSHQIEIFHICFYPEYCKEAKAMLNANILQDENNEMCLRNGTYTLELVRRNSCQLLSFAVMLLPGFYVFTVYWFLLFWGTTLKRISQRVKEGNFLCQQRLPRKRTSIKARHSSHNLP